MTVKWLRSVEARVAATDQSAGLHYTGIEWSRRGMEYCLNIISQQKKGSVTHESDIHSHVSLTPFGSDEGNHQAGKVKHQAGPFNAA